MLTIHQHACHAHHKQGANPAPRRQQTGRLAPTISCQASTLPRIATAQNVPLNESLILNPVPPVAEGAPLDYVFGTYSGELIKLTVSTPTAAAAARVRHSIRWMSQRNSTSTAHRDLRRQRSARNMWLQRVAGRICTPLCGEF